jgi:hypothetical protein
MKAAKLPPQFHGDSKNDNLSFFEWKDKGDNYMHLVRPWDKDDKLRMLGTIVTGPAHERLKAHKQKASVTTLICTTFSKPCSSRLRVVISHTLSKGNM